MKIITLLGVWLIAACGPLSGTSTLSDDNEIEEFNQHTEMWKKLVKDKTLYKCDFPTKRNCDPVSNPGPAGDSVLFNSLLCYSGVSAACTAVRDSQDSSGRFWRSPLHKELERAEASGSFSKDHVVGILLYLAVTKDRDTARKWIRWLQRDNNVVDRTMEIGQGITEDTAREISRGAECIGQGMPCITYQVKETWADLSRNDKIACGLLVVAVPPLGIICPAIIHNGRKLVEKKKVPKYLTLYFERVCEQQHCTMTPNLYALMYKVWKHIGLEPTTNMKVFSRIDSEGMLISQIKDMEPGPDLHLKAVTALIRLTTKQGATSKMIDAIVKRDGGNLFHMWLDRQSFPSLLQKFSTVAYRPREEVLAGVGHQWTWERDSTSAAEKDSMVWDFLFMSKMLQPELAVRAESYIDSIFYPRYNQLRRTLDDAITKLRAAASPLEAASQQAEIQASTLRNLISQVDIDVETLRTAQVAAQQHLQIKCPLNLRDSQIAGHEALIAFNALNDSLKGESKPYFVITNRRTVWKNLFDQLESTYEDIPELIERIAKLVEDNACGSLSQALAEVPRRIEADQREGLQSQLAAINQSILEALQEGARLAAIQRTKTSLMLKAMNLAADLQKARLERHYSHGVQVFDNANLFLANISFILSEEALLTATDRLSIQNSVKSVVEAETLAWKEFTQQFSATTIKASRRALVNRRAKATLSNLRESAVMALPAAEMYLGSKMQAAAVDAYVNCVQITSESCWQLVDLEAAENSAADATMDHFAEAINKVSGLVPGGV